MVLSIQLHSILRSNVLKKLDQAVDRKFIQSHSDGHFCNEMYRKLLLVPVNYGGIGVLIFSDMAENKYNNSTVTTASLIKLQL